MARDPMPCGPAATLTVDVAALLQPNGDARSGFVEFDLTIVVQPIFRWEQLGKARSPITLRIGNVRAPDSPHPISITVDLLL